MVGADLKHIPKAGQPCTCMVRDANPYFQLKEEAAMTILMFEHLPLTWVKLKRSVPSTVQPVFPCYSTHFKHTIPVLFSKKQCKVFLKNAACIMYISVIPRKSLIACNSIIFYLKMNCDLTSQLTHFEHISNADVMFS